ncbi:MAG: hypothetical protein U1E71_13470 [Ramlibacter sp.]|jgi:hypothetical protein
MRLLPALCLAFACGPLLAQTPPLTPPQAPLEGRKNQKVERIRVEDGATLIDEVRYAGQTQSITVQPKGGARAYEVQPGSGQRVWNVLNF